MGWVCVISQATTHNAETAMISVSLKCIKHKTKEVPVVKIMKLDLFSGKQKQKGSITVFFNISRKLSNVLEGHYNTHFALSLSYLEGIHHIHC